MCALHIPLPYTNKNQSLPQSFHFPESLHCKTNSYIDREELEYSSTIRYMPPIYIHTSNSLPQRNRKVTCVLSEHRFRSFLNLLLAGWCILMWQEKTWL
jgi:hypothetical protein